MTFDEFYGLNETDASGALTPKAAGRTAFVEKVRNKKQHGCTCDGRVLPQFPCNVFRKPITEDEKKEIKNKHRNNAAKYRQSMGSIRTSGDVQKIIASIPSVLSEEHKKWSR